jgi:hypothetical protein
MQLNDDKIPHNWSVIILKVVHKKPAQSANLHVWWLISSLIFIFLSLARIQDISLLCLGQALIWVIHPRRTRGVCVTLWPCHLSMKEGSLFCFVVMRSTELGCFRSCSWCLWKALDEERCIGLVPCPLDLRCKSSWILNDFFTENEMKWN